MALHIAQITLHNWRNIKRKQIQFQNPLTIFQGPNAAGKTNTLEAIQLLCSGQSFKHATPEQLLTHNSQQGSLQGALTGDKREIDIQIIIKKQEERFKRETYKNSKKTTAHALAGTLPTIFFTPDHLNLIKDSAHTRREEIDYYCSQLSHQYRDALKTYNRALDQRNRLLKDGVCNKELLQAWDESLIRAGSAILYARDAFLTHLQPFLQKVYTEITPTETLDIQYKSSLQTPFIAQKTQNEQRTQKSNAHGLSQNEWKTVLSKNLEANFLEDKRRGTTTRGPHRDDIVFFLDNQNARTYASQGQQRSIVLAWKLALVRYTEAHVGQTPLLLLDDVMGELDDKRRINVMDCLQKGIQTIITTTHTEYFQRQALKEAEIVTFP